ncbi:hypothetical protein IU449_26860 [Nocardia higoensis]|uniref:Uncharacterized protein n=1 Tax=Nocardia higoensis TaxID=228599 RepID=A0ABS0DI24_9NOCA|nr:hypothetical protein [Nocardia higoensis]MBF6358121.1 hypothetical protein [Nocardia higoensis]
MDIVGSEWVSRDGKRALFVLREVSEFRGDRMFMVRGTRGSGRERMISYPGLLKKYTRITEENLRYEFETVWCSRCARPRRVRVVPSQFSSQLPECCGVRDWCETEHDAVAAMAAANRQEN